MGEPLLLHVSFLRPSMLSSICSLPPHSELEDFVEDLKKDSSSTGRVVTLKDVEDGAFLLRQVGEAVATLKGEPSTGSVLLGMFMKLSAGRWWRTPLIPPIGRQRQADF